jgi:hypothetical protein
VISRDGALFVSFHSVTLPSVAIAKPKSEQVRFPSFWDLLFFCGIIAEMFFLGSFHRFSTRLQIAHLKPQTLKKYLGHSSVFRNQKL